MNIETVGTETGSDPVSSIRKDITGRPSIQNETVQNGVPWEGGFQAILQQIIAPINSVSTSGPPLDAGLSSSINTTTFVDFAEHQGIYAMEWAMSTDAGVPVVHPHPGLNVSLPIAPPDQEVVQNPPHSRVAVTTPPEPFLLLQATADQLTSVPAEMQPVKPDHLGEEVPPPGQAMLSDLEQTIETGSLRQSAPFSMHSMPKRILSNQETLAPEPPVNQESQIMAQPATDDVSGTPLKGLESVTVHKSSSGTQPNELTVTAPMKSCLILGGDRHARAVAELPGLGAVQVVMTRNNSEVTVSLQASKQSLPTLDGCSSTLRQLVSDSIQQIPSPGNPVSKDESGSSVTGDGLKIALSLTTTPDPSGSGRGRQHMLAGTSDFSGTGVDNVVLAPETEYRSPMALSRHCGMALIDLHI
ncbi:hypothetical protein J7438_14515 [Thalassotalea sp. G20_0]|uniref:hypothetical protein n=1 Tax=Thalassotalea sp. G20_0 TaxID=2821093 RepID=UPI001ADBBF25|nr:hypothetical protein [Thalassotalea sp. G20_0]MBO9495291.1 hypothetical protein [Thalassotalea sp. G20_0]